MSPSRIALAGAFALALLFATAAAASAQQQDSRPVRTWSFSEVREQLGRVEVVGDRQQGGRLFERHDFGPAAIDFVLPEDGIATGEIFSSATGNRYEVLAESPSHGDEFSGLGGISNLEQAQSYQKRADDATLRVTIAEALVKAVDDNGPVLLPSECAAGQKCSAITGIVRFEMRAYAESAGGDFFSTAGLAFIRGHAGHWTIRTTTLPHAKVPLWEDEQFTDSDDLFGNGEGSQAQVFLTEPLAVDVDLSSVATGDLFATEITFETQAIDTRGRESGVEAFIKNPEATEPMVSFTGLKPRGEPTFDAPPVTVPGPAVCPSGPAPGAGTLQFSQPDYVTDETVGAPFVEVTRIGGSTGAVSASVITSDGSAVAGADYTAVSTTVRFEDGDTSPRLVEIPIVQDQVGENNETFDVSLLDPNCGAFGAQTTAEVTITDVPELDLDEFTIGGTVTGLEGSGLVLGTSGADDLTIEANGAFEFTPPAPSGRVYDVSVVTAPEEPDQECTVANGAGTVDGADVTDVVVECSTPPPIEGLDPSFGGDGLVSTELPGNTEAVVVQPDGMIVSAGGGSDFTLTRHDTVGNLDETFDGDGDGNGIVTTNLGSSDIAMDVALQPDGKIVAVGKSGSDWAIARYLPDGILDDTFSDDGIVTTDFDGGFDTANGVVIDAEDRIVVAGNAQISPVFGHDFAIARYDEHGILDATFGGGDGLVTTELGTQTDLATDVALDADGRIIVAGHVLTFLEDFALVRYETDGDVDTTFGGGPVITDFGRSDSDVIRGVAVRPSDGKIVVAGHSSSNGSDEDFALAMYDPDGTLDTSLGNLGLVTTDIADRQFGDDFGEDLAIQADGKIVVVGASASDTVRDLAIVRYRADDAQLDATFDGDGILVTDFHGAHDIGNDVALQPDGKIVAAVDASNGGSFALARALP